MEFPDWVNIVPVTNEGKIVIIEQYRHATATVEWEVPGGSTEPDSGENASQAAARELLEETGYQATRIEHIASHYPNPAMQANFMHTFIGYGCQKVQAQQLDQYEDIVVVEKSVAEVYEMIRTGKLRHTIVMASILLALPHLGFQIPIAR
jgi:ADP-ribose pyrophosphatase